jgi:hypothetical protein
VLNQRSVLYTKSQCQTESEVFFNPLLLYTQNVGGNASFEEDTMKWKLLILILTFSGIAISCGTKELPRDLNESVAYFEKHWSSRQLDAFKNKNEKKAVAELHMSVGMWIRNNWIYGNRNPQLVKFFDSLNFRHQDDISSTILRSLHRKLNSQDIDLQGQIDYYEAYWKSIMECQENHRNELVELNKKFSVGDTLTLIFPVDTSQNYRNAVGYGCPDRQWTFDEAKDLRVKGIVTKKIDLNGPTNPFINFKITEMSDANTRIYMRDLTIGDTTEFALSVLTIRRE